MEHKDQHNLFGKIKSAFTRKVTFTEQEELFLDQLRTELEKKNTVKCTPPTGPWFISNAESGKVFRLGVGSASFACPRGTSQFICSFEVSDVFRDTVEQKIREEANEWESELRTKEVELFYSGSE